MLRAANLSFTAVAPFQTKVCNLLNDLNRFDNSPWQVHGVSQVQNESDKGLMGDASEYLRNLIITMGVEARFPGVQHCGKLSIATTNGWHADKFPDSTYIRLPLTSDSWNQQMTHANTAAIDSTTYRIDITVPLLGPELLFITLPRFGNDLHKLRNSAITPADITVGEEIYTRLATVNRGGPSLSSCHFWMAGRCQLSSVEFVYNDALIFKMAEMKTSSSAYAFLYRKKAKRPTQQPQSFKANVETTEINTGYATLCCRAKWFRRQYYADQKKKNNG